MARLGTTIKVSKAVKAAMKMKIDEENRSGKYPQIRTPNELILRDSLGTTTLSAEDFDGEEVELND
jgi:hypothetical protein